MSLRRGAARPLASATLLVALIGLTAAPAGAHAELVEAAPAPDSVVLDAPTEVVLVFSEAVQLAVDPLVVTAADGSRVHGEPAVDPANVLTAPVGPLPPGVYGVTYRILADDGHIIEGAYGFTVAAPPTTASLPIVPSPSATAPTSTTLVAGGVQTTTTAAAAPATTGSSGSDESPFGLALLAAAAVIGLVGGLTAWMMNRRARPR